MKRIILSGGGTGGHIYPAITIAKEISRIEEAEILFVGTPNGMESKIIPKEGYKFASIHAYGLKRSFTVKNIANLAVTAKSVFRAKKILKEFNPDVVIGTGGYVCGPILMAAALQGIPTLIQEQNVIPGITNKILSRFVDRIALGYKEAAHRFPDAGKCVYTGNPIRRDILAYNRADARKELGISEDTFMVLITGGSRGARSINHAMIGVHKHFGKGNRDILLYHVTGSLGYQDVLKELENSDEKSNDTVSHIVEYEYQMPKVLAAADLIICRAGAISLAELSARELPSILVPYPYAAEDHQTFNARVFEKNGAAYVILDKELTDEALIDKIELLMDNPEELKNMAQKVTGLRKIHAGEDIAHLASRRANSAV